MAPFIVFEGIDGSGKSTQIELLRETLVANGHEPHVTREPGGTRLGDEADQWLKGIHKLSAITELLLFNAVRAEHVTKVIRPALDEGRIVLCDRFTPSTIAYQGYGRNLGTEVVGEINRLATFGLIPTLTIFLDLPVESAQSRSAIARKWDESQLTLWTGLRGDANLSDQFERQNRDFYRRVRKGYLEMAARNPETWLTLDGALPVDTLARKIWARVHPLL